MHEATLHAEFSHAVQIPDLTRPNFGNYDQEVATSLKHTSLAEKETNHKMKGTYPREVPIPDLTRPNFGDKDEDILSTQKHLADAEINHEVNIDAGFYKAA